MNPLSMLAAGGVWIAAPLTGYLMLRGSDFHSEAESVPLVTWLALVTTTGLVVWSPLLLGTAIAGMYRPAVMGALGWGVSVFAALRVWTRWRAAPPRLPALSTWDWIFLGGLVVAGLLYFGFPGESIYGGRDEGVYANHAVYIANHGRLDVPYPWPTDANGVFGPAWVGFPGFYKTEGTMTATFGHLFPVWMAQGYATLGADGLFRVNAVFALLTAAVFYGMCRTVLPAMYAVPAALFLALNPSQLWMARMTLSEISAQLFTWSGLLLLSIALQNGSRSVARWAGIFFAVSALVRFDSFLMVPMLFLAQMATRLIEEPTGKSTPVWVALYEAALPAFVLAAVYYRLFSTPYMMERRYLYKLAFVSAVTPLPLLAFRPKVVALVRPWLTARVTLSVLGVAWFALCFYGYFIRSAPSVAPRMRFRWPGYYLEADRDYSVDTMVNLGRYLSPPVVWAGLAGWFTTLSLILRQRRDLHLFAMLVIILGFSYAHFTDAISEDHFWAARRFTPVVVPGFILLATLAVRWLLSKLPAQAALAAAAAAAIGLGGFTLWADRLILTFAEDSGYFAQVEHLARKLPPDQVILARGFTEWLTPLYFAFDRHVVPLNLDPGAPGRPAFTTWLAQQTAAGKKTYMLLEGSTDLRGVRYRKLDEAVITRVFTEPTINPLPTKLITKQRRVGIYEITAEQ